MNGRTFAFPLLLMLAAAGLLIAPTCLHAAAAPSYDFTAIDQHALNAPPEAEQSIEKLSAYLARPARNDLEKTRAIYRWVTKNIAYDMQSFKKAASGAVGPARSADSILKSRGAVCSGYAGLFASLAVPAGLKAVIIDGSAKGFGYKVGSQMTKTCGHEWNAVSIDGKWVLIDCAWGAGYINEQEAQVREFDDHFFMTPPAEFIYDHYPTDPKWQLLERAVSKEEFESLPFLRPAFFHNGLKLVSHTKGAIQADGSVTVTLSASTDIQLMAELSRDGQTIERMAMAQREDGIYNVYVALPKQGKYILEVYTKRADDPGKYSSAVDYVIEATRGAEGVAGFPEVLGTFGEKNGRLYEPMSGRLKTGERYPFKIKAPGAEDVAIVLGKEWSRLTKNGDVFEGLVFAGNGSMKVAAKYPGRENYDVLLEYQADEQAPLPKTALSFAPK